MRLFVTLLVSLVAGCSCDPEVAQHPDTAAPRAIDAGPQPAESTTSPAPGTGQSAHLDAEFPLHGLVTGVHLSVRREPNADAAVLGWLRFGARIRARAEPTKTRTCATGWYEIAPGGWACAGQGIALSDTPPASPVSGFDEVATDGLPYAYYFVKEPKVPEYHRLPSRKEQQQVKDFVARYTSLTADDPERASRFLRGELPKQAAPPKVVRRFLDRGFFVAGVGRTKRHGRNFVTTVRGAFLQEAQLQPRHGSEFHGVEIGKEQPLPVAWAVRTARPFAIKKRPEGGLRLVADEAEPAYPRHGRVPWVASERVADQLFHRLEDGRYLKHWFVAVAQRVKRPKRIGADEPWVHVSLGQQTLVLYRGDEPVYATLVSTGLPEHETPTGLFAIRVKHRSASMSDIGPEVGDDDRYSIEDVPFTQYFERSFALHGAFWHDRFGLQRSHGCVNLSPADARRVFEHTWPPVTDGWHGLSSEQTGQKASAVWVTSR